MPVETRSSRKARLDASRARRHRKPKPAPPSRHVPSRPIQDLRDELQEAVEQTKDLEQALQEILERLHGAQQSLDVAKRHHHGAAAQARESKKIICRYLDLSMTVPPCKSLDLPMEVYSDESVARLAQMIREQETGIAQLKRCVGGVREQAEQSRKNVCRLKRKIYREKVKAAKNNTL